MWNPEIIQQQGLIGTWVPSCFLQEVSENRQSQRKKKNPETIILECALHSAKCYENYQECF